MKERPVMFSAWAVADAGGIVDSGPRACVLVDVEPISRGKLPRLLATGPGARAHPLARVAPWVDRPGGVIIPGLVNAHAHLDLTHIGPRPHDPQRGFVSWIDMIRAERAHRPGEIAASVRQGVELSRRGGTVAIGDIGGATAGKANPTAWQELSRSALLGVSFLEFFSIGKGTERGLAGVEEVLRGLGPPSPSPVARGVPLTGGKGGGAPGVRLGLQPHATNTVRLASYQRAVELAQQHALPLSTHLAESWEEREFIARGTGAQRVLLERLGIWDEAMLEEIGQGRHPVEHLAPLLQRAPFLVAHVNDADDAAIQTLARTRTTVVYCPRASAYFGAERRFGAHRYRDMRAAGVPVALGTDSIVNLDTPDRLSVLDEMRLLYHRDRADPRALLTMATENGATALGLERCWFQLGGGRLPRPIAGLVWVGVGVSQESVLADPVREVLLSARAPELLLDRIFCCSTGSSPN